MSKPRVLIVDDAVFMRDMIMDIIAKDPNQEYEFVEASHGNEAVEKFRDLRPDLTIMDLMMPYKNGVDAIREIISIDKSAKVVIVAAIGQESLVREGLDAGALDFVMKPFTAEDFLGLMKKVLAHTSP